jgi:hypothetical protein
MTDWLSANWQTIGFIALPVPIAIIDAVTRHYTDSKGVTRALLLVVDVLNVLRPLFAPSSPPKSLKVALRIKGSAGKGLGL